jgi:hypothetical protein
MTSTDFTAAEELRALRQRVAQERMKYLVDLGKMIRHRASASIRRAIGRRCAGPFARPKTAAN